MNPGPLRRDEGGYTLNGEMVHPGDLLDLQLEDGRWLPVRFETGGDGQAFAVVAVAGTREPVAARLPVGVILRRP